MTDAYIKLKAILEELFQLDQADLDFGIYRIMNQKRNEITDFLDNQLLAQISKTLDASSGEGQQALTEKLKQLEATLRGAGVDPDTNEKVRAMRAELTSPEAKQAMENEVYSHLTSFFRRYYKDGDFISQRRYKEDVYAIPYEGEEVKLYWANHDQYYIKTSEHFKDFRFTLRDNRKVHFRLRDASTEKDNNKAQSNMERRFRLADEDVFSEEAGELSIWFTYETVKKTTKQDKLMEQAFSKLKETLPKAWLTELLAPKPTAKNKDRTLLQKYLKDYTARNTFDYFIHKDLGKFLNRELDFYIKNEILHLDDINLEEEQDFSKQLRVIKALKIVARKLIAFLAQLEDFQKKLWLKKKFVLQSEYCITLDRIDQQFYKEIAANDEQREEWVKLFAIDELEGYSTPLTVDFLKANPYLQVDTQFFPLVWKYALLAKIDHLDEQTDGLLLNSENFQALRLMEERYREKVKCIHIDPPYNTTTSGFLYKNNYQHSTWLSMMIDRIIFCKSYLTEGGLIQSHIDENEYENLFKIFNSLHLVNAGSIIWDKRNPMNGGSGIALQHEYIITFTKERIQIQQRNANIISMLTKVKDIISSNNGIIDDKVKKIFSNWVSKNKKLSGGEKAYRYVDENGRIYQSVSLRAPEPRSDKKFHKALIHPITQKPCVMPPNGFSRTPETLQKMVEKGEIIFGKDETTQPRQKVFLTAETKRQLTSIITDAKTGKSDTDELGINFPYCHPLSLYKELVGVGNVSNNDLVMDYFAGSGTTAHAVININNEDNGHRKYILVEMGEYFNSVTKPRVQKVAYSKDWKNGKPVGREGISHCFKYLRLESYEDTLNNLELQRGTQQTSLMEDHGMREEYMLHYMLDVESSGGLLHTGVFRKPFGYTIKTTEHNEQKETEVDLVETFNYLIGLEVESIQLIRGYVVVTGTTNTEGEKTLVIWRDLDVHDNEALNAFFEKMQFSTRDSEFDRIYVNGDNNLQNLKSDAQQWKVSLIEEEFHKRMFDIKEL